MATEPFGFGNSLPEPTEPTVCQNGSAEPTRRSITIIYNIATMFAFCFGFWVQNSDRPTRRFGSVRPNRSDKQWVRSVLAKNFRN